jgi:hypothetical protein
MFTLTELEDAAALIGRTLAPRRNAPGRRSETKGYRESGLVCAREGVQSAR